MITRPNIVWKRLSISPIFQIPLQLVQRSRHVQPCSLSKPLWLVKDIINNGCKIDGNVGKGTHFSDSAATIGTFELKWTGQRILLLEPLYDTQAVVALIRRPVHQRLSIIRQRQHSQHFCQGILVANLALHSRIGASYFAFRQVGMNGTTGLRIQVSAENEGHILVILVMDKFLDFQHQIVGLTEFDIVIQRVPIQVRIANDNLLLSTTTPSAAAML